MQTSGAVRRENATLYQRHCERSEAIHSAACGDVDCFVASLPCANASRLSQAMTWEGRSAPNTPHTRHMRTLWRRAKFARLGRAIGPSLTPVTPM